jgi:hypothetical protein
MKKIVLMLAAVTALVPILFTNALAEKKEVTSIQWTAQAFTTTSIVDVSSWDRFSAQAVYSTGNQSTHTLTSGGRASATITVTKDYSLLVSTQAKVTINIFLNSGVTNDAVTINGIVFKEGVNWSVGSSSIASAANLAARIDAHPEFAATSLGSTVTVRYITVGTEGNGVPVLTTDATNLVISAATMTGGVNQHTININGVTLTEGIDFVVATSSLTTASNIMSAINSNATLSAQIIASTFTTTSSATAIVTIKSINTGYSSFSLVTSTAAGFAFTTGFPGGASSDIDIVNDVITKENHGFTLGLGVLISTTGSNLPPTGLFSGTTYYVIKVNDNKYSLASSQANALAGTKVDITGVTDGSVASAYPVPLSQAAGNGFYWSFSNDAVTFSTWTAVNTSISSATYSGTGGNMNWDFGSFNYKYIAVNFLKPTAGAIRLFIKLYGKKD